MECDGKSEARDKREGMRWIDRQRRQQRKNIVKEMILDPGSFRLTDVAAVYKDDADFGQDTAQISPDRLLVPGKLRDNFADAHELLRRSQSVRAALGNAFAHLGLDAGHTHHEELIKVIGRNRQESHPLQRGVTRIDRFLKHPAIEVQPGKLPIDETFRALSHRMSRVAGGFFFFNYNSLCGFH